MGRLPVTGVRRRRAVAVLAGLVVVTGCGSDAGGEGDPPGGDASTVTVYWVDGDGKLSPVEREVEGAAQMRPQGRAVAAVGQLVLTTPEKDDGLISHWGGRCSVGAKIEDLAEEGRLITLRVRGAAGVMCQRKGAALAQQRQQLAWTVVENLGADPSTPVRLYGSNGAKMWEDVVADEKFLAK